MALVCLVLTALPCGQKTLADVGIDIRSDGVLVPGSADVNYTAAFDDCSELLSVTLGTGDAAEVRGASDLRATAGGACEVSFSSAGDARFRPQVSASFRDGTSQAHVETFQIENTAPELSIQSVALAQLGGKQNLVVTLTASDDVDLSHVVVSALGLRASVLRAVGGIVERARAEAFADSTGTQRVYPRAEGDSSLELVLPVTRPLTRTRSRATAWCWSMPPRSTRRETRPRRRESCSPATTCARRPATSPCAPAS